MLLLYRLLFPVALLALLPLYLPRMLRRGGYFQHFGQRLGRVPKLPAKSAGAQRIWVHAVSVGELLALGPLLDLLRQEHPSAQIVMTTTTSTGYALAERKYGPNLTYLGYFPLDFWPMSRRTWERLQPDLCLLMEGELWPEHLHQARIRQIPALLINARISERSFRRWRSLPPLLRTPLVMVTTFVAASDEDARRFALLGVSEDRIQVGGNLKLDFSPAPILDPTALDLLRRELGLRSAEGNTRSVPPALVLAGASTWPGEEEMLTRVVRQLEGQGISCQLLLIPRHAERRAEIRKQLSKEGRRVHFRTSGPASGPVDVVVADTTGEVVLLLQTADVVFVGKSMDPHRGGQNPIEAAALGKAVLFGPNMQNFRAVVGSMLEAGAGRCVRDEAELAQAVAELLGCRKARDAMGQAARQWHQASTGATRRTAEVVNRFLGPAIPKPRC
ncbi:3-deoxy-D-manno-octulosonic acid transferase [Desulfonatronum thioautotrophicum]|uniref:3-deoxy-D-manno-octulosonic acid transferase n=1 Tax=Desulfonatronum thioautotrophicum TaxID=617001 RepID=UPI0005EB578C|nr:3-deoxy-D-manno-octulosonic acid transferase [Desulfonatronum thioautotrophicum]